MKIFFTKHVNDKLQEEEIKKVGITGEKIVNVLKNPVVVDEESVPHHSVGKLSESLSLNVIWKIENRAKKVITFYPAGKGRYESKILRRR